MSRSKWKGVFVNKNLLKKIFNKKKNNDFIYIHSRNSTIIKEFVGLHFKVYNGIRYFNVFVTEQLVGHKFGEFSYTRRLSQNIHEKSKNKKKKKRNKC